MQQGQGHRHTRHGCDDCQSVMINGIFCHETGCPSAWKDRKVSCFECGFDFQPENRGERVCPDCQNDADGRG